MTWQPFPFPIDAPPGLDGQYSRSQAPPSARYQNRRGRVSPSPYSPASMPAPNYTRQVMPYTSDVALTLKAAKPPTAYGPGSPSSPLELTAAAAQRLLEEVHAQAAAAGAAAPNLTDVMICAQQLLCHDPKAVPPGCVPCAPGYKPPTPGGPPPPPPGLVTEADCKTREGLAYNAGAEKERGEVVKTAVITGIISVLIGYGASKVLK